MSLAKKTGQRPRLTQTTLRILRVLVDAQDPVWGRTVAEKIELTYSNVTANLRRLAAYEWVEATSVSG